MCTSDCLVIVILCVQVIRILQSDQSAERLRN